ncbi:bacteriohemerythrin [Haloarcula montana]|uniref:bacteriohemerythrin n=1 Tax=Haloarcula montana TaxID=3111776 RepID=UPI002D79AB13|nr:bacteriohemerythrin [Haloarcula sp. GH36]
MESRSGETFIEWIDDRYSTDIDRFDEQHKHLFGLLNDLYVAMDEGHSEEAIGDILRELERYTEYHFGDEEEFMQDCGYAMDCADCFYNHREMHEEFAQTVSEFRERHENGEPITMDVLEFARDWLDAHIAASDEDQKYAGYYRESVPEDYEYSPGKLNTTREGDRTYEAPDDETAVVLRSNVHVGGAVSIPHGTMADWLADRAADFADRPVAYVRTDAGYETRTFEAFYERARQVAGGLLDAGVEPGTTVGIRAAPSYEWSVVDAACHLAGLISVPIYPAFSDERAVATETTDGVSVLVTDDTASEAVTEVADTVFGLDSLPTAEIGDLPGFDADPDDIATVVHQIGRDADPLGCSITHRNLLAAVATLGNQFPVSPGATGTCLLPLSHVFQRVATYYLWDNGAGTAYLPADDFIEGLQAVEPDILVGVPRVYEHLHDTFQDRIDDLGRMKRRLADGAAIERGEARSGVGGSSLTDSAAARLVLRPVREQLGLGNVEHALSGLGTLPADLLYFFWGCDIPVSQVYGATELTGVGCLVEHDSATPGALGSPMPGTEVAIAEDGEILFRGDHVVDSYWETSDVAVSATQDGWYHTGDYGEFDDAGRLHRVDRD